MKDYSDTISEKQKEFFALKKDPDYRPQDVVEKAYELIGKIFGFRFFAIFADSETLDIHEEYFTEEHPYLLANIRRFREGGILDWARTLDRPAKLPDWESAEKKSCYIAYAALPNKDTSLLFVGAVEKNMNEIEDETLDEVSFYLRDILGYFSEKILIRENATLRSRLKFINTKVLEQSKFATFGELAEYGLHGIRTTLSQVDAHLKFIESGLGNPETRIEVIRNHFDKAKDEMSGLLSIYADSGSRTNSIIDLNELLNKFLIFIERFFISRNITLECEIEDNLPPVKANHSTLYYTFFNIIRNAARAMPESGKFTFSVYSDKEKVHFTFADTGVGMSDEEMERVFIPFISSPNRPNDLGISLYIIKNILSGIGGKIKIASSEGDGTTVKISLPLLTKPE